MRSLSPYRLFGRASKTLGDNLPSAAADAAAQVFPALAPTLTVGSAIHPAAQAALDQWGDRFASSRSAATSRHEHTVLSALGWMSAGIGTVTIGLVLGHELRRRYKFNRRTPYDFYAHSGDERDLEFGVGI